MQRVLQATNTLVSILLPFTQTVPQTITREAKALSRSFSLRRSTLLPAASPSDLELPPHAIGPLPERKRSWAIKRRPSWRRMPTIHARDWSHELEESEYCLPFDVCEEEMERGTRSRVVSFLDEMVVLPTLDTTSFSQGLGIDLRNLGLGDGCRLGVGKVVEEEEEGRGDVDGFEFGRILGLVETESVESDESLGSEGSGIESLVTDVSAAESEWTAFSEEAEGIEMFF